jgi:hypothetical protein
MSDRRPPVGRLAVLFAALAAFLPAAASTAGTAGTVAGYDVFRMPSGNIACAYFAGGPSLPALRCDILSGLAPEPRRACELDWTGLTLSARGPARPACAGDTVFSPTARTLAYGDTWRRGAFRCESRFTGLTCTSAAGHGLFLARRGWRAW